jgi:hypothetical protein
LKRGVSSETLTSKGVGVAILCFKGFDSLNRKYLQLSHADFFKTLAAGRAGFKKSNKKMKNVLLTAAALICVASASIGQSLPAYLPADGLVGWWPFNGNANDESGNGNDGYNYLFNGSAFYLNPSPSNSYGVDRNGNIERALKTNIYGSNVMLPINNFLFQSDFTISIWAKNDSLVAQYPTILESSNNHLTMQFGNTGGPISFGAYLTEIGISPFGEVGALTQPLEWLHITLVNENYQNKLYFLELVTAINCHKVHSMVLLTTSQSSTAPFRRKKLQPYTLVSQLTRQVPAILCRAIYKTALLVTGHFAAMRMMKVEMETTER